MSGYTKLFNSILASTIWRAPDKTRIVWITLLAMADKDGVAEGSIPGLADMARVSLPDCEKALEELYSPDPYSRTTEYEGRRIEKIEGGWQILNHGKYREKMSADERREYFRKKQQEWRDRKKLSNNVNHGEGQSTLSTHTEAAPKAEAKSDAEAPTPKREESKSGFSDGKDSRLLPTTPISQRIAALFSRRLTTAWSEVEVKAYKRLGKIEDADLELIERYYAQQRSRGDEGKHRRDLGTFLNNFTGELDRARAAIRPLVKPPAAEAAPDPAGWSEWLAAHQAPYQRHQGASRALQKAFEERKA